jgi:hypothetical protein
MFPSLLFYSIFHLFDSSGNFYLFQKSKERRSKKENHLFLLFSFSTPPLIIIRLFHSSHREMRWSNYWWMHSAAPGDPMAGTTSWKFHSATDRVIYTGVQRVKK